MRPGRWEFPAVAVGLAVDVLDVVRARHVAVAGAVSCAGEVGLVLCLAAVGVHLHKVERAIEGAGSADINIGEFTVLELEDLVGLVVVEEEGPGADGLGVAVLGHKVELDRIAVGVDAVALAWCPHPL